jgi:hypothetical protein
MPLSPLPLYSHATALSGFGKLQGLSSSHGQVLASWELSVLGEGQERQLSTVYCHLNSAFMKAAFSPSYYKMGLPEVPL